MKCAILTISVGIPNYGNRLQNYALQETLKSLGCEVETVDYKPVYPQSSYDSISGKQEMNFWEFKSLVKRRLLYLRNRQLIKEKNEKFLEFTRNKINWTEQKYTIDSDFSELAQCFNYMIAGSDQIWNPYWEGTQPIYFMEFMPKENRIAYAASFGLSHIPDSMKDYYKNKLNSIKHISCREDRGVEIVHEIAGAEAVQVLDPVFLVKPTEWQKIETKPVALHDNKPYILAYFLGSISKEYIDKLNHYKKTLNCNILFLDKKDKLSSIFASPSEFLYLIRNAKLVCTDSFHGLAFSLIFNRPIVYFNRSLDNGKAQDMASRMTSLFNMFECDNRFMAQIKDEELLKMNFDKINSIIEQKKEYSLGYLRKALDL